MQFTSQIIQYCIGSCWCRQRQTVARLYEFTLCSITMARRNVCYFQSWAKYRPGNGRFVVDNIDPNLPTHIIYCFADIKANAEVKLHDDSELGDVQRFNSLRNINRNLKTMAAIGGANADGNLISQVVNNAASRALLANNIVRFALQYGFNGIDLDWEYPTNKEAFTHLLMLLRPMFDQYGLILSAAVSAGIETIDASYNVPALAAYVDFINVMTYDLHGPWETVTGQNSPLYAGPADTAYQQNLNVHAAINHWIRMGAPKDKLNLGIATYGRSFTLQDAAQNGVGAPATGPGIPGPYTQDGGCLGYNEICEYRIQGLLNEQWNREQWTAYAVSGNQWIGYDNVAAVRIKAQYIRENGLGGAMVWAINTDDFHGFGGEGTYPLIRTIRTNLG